MIEGEYSKRRLSDGGCPLPSLLILRNGVGASSLWQLRGEDILDPEWRYVGRPPAHLDLDARNAVTAAHPDAGIVAILAYGTYFAGYVTR